MRLCGIGGGEGGGLVFCRGREAHLSEFDNTTFQELLSKIDIHF